VFIGSLLCSEAVRQPPSFEPLALIATGLLPSVLWGKDAPCAASQQGVQAQPRYAFNAYMFYNFRKAALLMHE
jgi:hypothetical protein